MPRRPVHAHEQGADFTFRQSLIDLASIAELLADELPAPGAPPRFDAAELDR